MGLFQLCPLLAIPILCLLQYVKAVNDYLGPAISSLLGGVLRKDGKKMIASDAEYI